MVNSPSFYLPSSFLLIYPLLLHSCVGSILDRSVLWFGLSWFEFYLCLLYEESDGLFLLVSTGFISGICGKNGSLLSGMWWGLGS